DTGAAFADDGAEGELTGAPQALAEVGNAVVEGEAAIADDHCARLRGRAGEHFGHDGAELFEGDFAETGAGGRNGSGSEAGVVSETGGLALFEEVDDLGESLVLAEHVDEFAANFVVLEQLRRRFGGAWKQRPRFEVDQFCTDG